MVWVHVPGHRVPPGHGDELLADASNEPAQRPVGAAASQVTAARRTSDDEALIVTAANMARVVRQQLEAEERLSEMSDPFVLPVRCVNVHIRCNADDVQRCGLPRAGVIMSSRRWGSRMAARDTCRDEHRP